MKEIRMISLMALALSIMFFQIDTAWADTRQPSFKIIGYYSGSLFDEPVDKLQTDKLTHVIYAFLIPREDGTLIDLEKPEQLKQLVDKAHRDGARVFIAIGGWSYQNKPLQPVFEAVAASDDTRKLLIENICKFVTANDLDGAELDWEHPNADSIGNYEKLVVELKAALDYENKELTAALNGAWSKNEGPEVSKLMTDRCLNCFSFINVMAYDMNNEAHSPLWFADTSVDYWLNRGVPAEKIVLGMPLYARPSWLQYRQLAALDPDYVYTDHAATTPLASHYNGINTLREKTVIALSKAGGVMLFDVNEDTGDETSIVSMIHNIKTRTGDLTPEDMKKYVTVVLNDRELPFLPEEGMGVPFIDENSRTLIPLRKPLEAIGAQVSYDEKKRVVVAEKDGVTVEAAIDENVIYVNGNPVVMDTMAIIKDGRTYIPLRQVFEAFGCKIEWHGSSRTVLIAGYPLVTSLDSIYHCQISPGPIRSGVPDV